jgi:hypothetical protein
MADVECARIPHRLSTSSTIRDITQFLIKAVLSLLILIYESLSIIYSVYTEHAVAMYNGDKYITIIVIVKENNSNRNMTAIVKQSLFTRCNRLTVYTENCCVKIKLHLNMHLPLLLLL